MHQGSYVGIGKNGVATDPSKTRNTDPEAQFYFTIIKLVQWVFHLQHSTSHDIGRLIHEHSLASIQRRNQILDHYMPGRPSW